MPSGPKIFLSYRREDSAFQTTAIHEKLVEAFGAKSVFMDVEKMPAGCDFREHLRQQIRSCDVCLAVIGEKWLEVRDDAGRPRLDDAGDYLRFELESALVRGIPLIPVLIGDQRIPPEASLPESLRELSFRHAVTIRPGRDFRNDVNMLIAEIRTAHREHQDAARDHPGPKAHSVADGMAKRTPLEILGEAARIVMTNLMQICGIAAAILVPYWVVFASVVASRKSYDDVAGFMTFWLLFGAVAALPVMNAALMNSMVSRELHRPSSTIGALLWAMIRSPALIGTWALVCVVISCGTLLLVVPGIIAAVRLPMALQVVVFEKLSPVEALKRSWTLMAGNEGTTTIIYLLFIPVLIVLCISGIMVSVFYGNTDGPITLGVASAGLAILQTAVFTVLYVSYRSARETFAVSNLEGSF